jgi:hypothetical protein
MSTPMARAVVHRFLDLGFGLAEPSISDVFVYTHLAARFACARIASDCANVARGRAR